MSDKMEFHIQNGGTHDQRGWVEPEIVILDASDMEAGGNKVIPEGAFAEGS